MKTNFIRFLPLFVALGFVSLLQAEPVLAGNKALAGQSLDADGIKAVLLGKKITLGDARVVIVIANPFYGTSGMSRSTRAAMVA